MTVLIEIPKEYEEHFNMDMFKDSLERIRVDVETSIELSQNIMSGICELELIKMLRTAFINAKIFKG